MELDSWTAITSKSVDSLQHVYILMVDTASVCVVTTMDVFNRSDILGLYKFLVEWKVIKSSTHSYCMMARLHWSAIIRLVWLGQRQASWYSYRRIVSGLWWILNYLILDMQLINFGYLLKMGWRYITVKKYGFVWNYWTLVYQICTLDKKSGKQKK